MGRACETYREKEKWVTGCRWGNLTESEHLETLRRRWEDNIKMLLRGIGWKDVC